ncbi:MAG: hypothetical protein JKY93_12195 [Gammaproteobacteria bacterium]|nr:hypothetical protein [Gammaproteobacteria bacterium]
MKRGISKNMFEIFLNNGFFLHFLDEDELDEVIISGGGKRAHPDHDSRKLAGADYIFENVVIELKTLNEERLLKPATQKKLAALFVQELPERPVQVIDREILSEDGQNKYDQILQNPIKADVRKAKKQLEQTRAEHPDTTLSILWFHNNGYAALSHEELITLALRRVRNDTSKIDGIIVSGVYYTSDSFESEVVWPISYHPIHLGNFQQFKQIKSGWNSLAEETMTGMVTGSLSQRKSEKNPFSDIVFDVDNITYVKPSPILSAKSDFFKDSRPRVNSSGLECRPPVATTFPILNFSEWSKIRNAIGYYDSMFSDYEEWEFQKKNAVKQATVLKPLVPISIQCKKWLDWCVQQDVVQSGASVGAFANALFEDKCRHVLNAACEFDGRVTKSSYIAVSTTEIGRDIANDLSSIALITEGLHGTSVLELVNDAQIFHEHAVALASAYAVLKGVSQVFWFKNKKYGWH